MKVGRLKLWRRRACPPSRLTTEAIGVRGLPENVIRFVRIKQQAYGSKISARRVTRMLYSAGYRTLFSPRRFGGKGASKVYRVVVMPRQVYVITP